MVRLAADLRERHGLKARPVAAARLHLSLNFVGNFRGPPTRAVMEKAAALADRVAEPPFKITLDHVESWTNHPQPIVLLGEEGAIGAERLHTAIHKALVVGTMAPRREPQIRPHVTLLWDKGTFPKTFVEPVSWTAQEFVLLDSIFGEGRHEVLGRWRLTG
jgi:RNA 2',3'-cyclic 3'-phosphodiesterase